MKLLNFTIIKLTLSLIVGILLGSHFSIPFGRLLLGLSILFAALLFLFIRSRNSYRPFWLFDMVVIGITIIIGSLTVYVHEAKNDQHHYSHLIDESNEVVFTAKVREVLKPNAFQQRYVLKLQKLNDHKVHGKVILNVSRDSTYKPLLVDEVITTKATLVPIGGPLNPHQFDYRTYLKRRYIYHQVTLAPNQIASVQKKPSTIFGLSFRLRNRIMNSLNAHDVDPDALSIINALLLGQRQDISKETYGNYVDAGAIHILAVSGLHVAIVIGILYLLLTPLTYFKNGRKIQTLFIVLAVWSFAVIAGLSPSVVRAATMFSLLTVALNSNRLTNTTNVVAASMFVLLLTNPNYLFEVGFQMSYAAVLAIVWFNPVFNKLLVFPKGLRWVWNTFTISCAAQLGVLPIGLFYFHQFPGLFFITNLVIIPLLGMIIGLGILVILLALLNVLPLFVANIYGLIIGSMNQFIAWVAQQEAFVFKDISFSLPKLIISYLLIFSFLALLKRYHVKRFAFVLISILLFQGVIIYEKFEVHGKHELMILHKSRGTIIIGQKAQRLVAWSTLDSLQQATDKTIIEHAVASTASMIQTDTLKNVYVHKNKTLLIVDRAGVYEIEGLHPDMVLLIESPKINLERLIKILQPKVIIADGSNYRSFAARWKNTCRLHKVPFHYTAENGGFIIAP
ncbi:ComEC/Rec2 family competence protein [Sungkyunkwania multivorans]|uniref:ComEC/Rec2 family competence protein n=1 Tax=Sungkyunkwania multivorans TaxID=1173618 RepID=A0ABW3D509_9FLAO